MDFWSRLLSPLGGHEYGSLLSTWRTTNLRDGDAAETLEIRLQELTNILSDESRRPLPHPCIQYASIKQIYVPIGKIATASHNEWIIKEAVLLFATLIESEEEAFVENPTFSTSLTNLLVRITGAEGVHLGLDTESRVVELAFNITTKIRLDPSILPACAGAGALLGLRRPHTTSRLPLFYILVDYIHHEGKVGDFARTGLLYIIEAASSSAALEQWIVESDLSTLMATGLGALYSQLSRKLVIDHPPHDLPPILALSDYQHPTSSYEILYFLQQLLYPSLLESSDIDGGSSVAVLTYLRRILESLNHPDMINLILHYLLALPDTLPSREQPRSSISLARKRKSMDLATMMAEKSEDAATPLLFNLVDLILACLRSRNQQTIHVTLQLVSAILKRHHRYAVITLLKTEVLPANSVDRTVGAHEQEVEYLVSLASSIGGQGNFDETYANILKDTMTRLESHPCSLRLVAPRVSTNNRELPAIPDSLPGAPRDIREHTLLETNLSVSETLVDLAICGYMSIEGWLARSPSGYAYAGDGEHDDASASEVEPVAPDAEAERLRALKRCRTRPEWSTGTLPRILAILQRLPPIRCWTTPRKASPQPPLQGTPERPSMDEVLRTGSPSRPSALEGFAQRLLSELGTPSRSASPKGRKEQSRSSGTSTPGGVQPELMTPNAIRVPPKEFPINYADPSRSGGARSLSPGSAAGDALDDRRRRDSSATSQASAFAAIDQSTLARRVGLPDDRLKPIPLRLDRPARSVPEELAAGAAPEEEHGANAEDASETGAVGAAAAEVEGAVDAAAYEEEEEVQVSVSHVITNVIIFQSFLLELAGLMQVRAGLFDEVRYV
ncbi:hypothetical protein ACCO45_013319 [Purpureocillium lilacinum]|uniref:Uncharacterized protein n=1 Tax=Purpureocillium lilacinum TaxID=33203 RepID=A0ACC4DAV3_PURLI